MTFAGRRTVYAVPVDAGQVIDGVAGIIADEQMFLQIPIRLFMSHNYFSG